MFSCKPLIHKSLLIILFLLLSPHVLSQKTENIKYADIFIEDKKVPFNIDHTSATFSIEAEDDSDTSLYPNFMSAIKDIEKLSNFSPLPSVSMINAINKDFNDHLCATLEISLQKGIKDKLIGKKIFLNRLLKKLLDYRKSQKGFSLKVTNEAIIYIGTGLYITDKRMGRLPKSLKKVMIERFKKFDKDKQISKPIGFYDWNKELREIFKQDRHFQKVISFIRDKDEDIGAVILISYLIGSDKSLKKSHKDIVGFYSSITNPIDALTVKTVCKVIKEKNIKEYIRSKKGIERFKKAISDEEEYKALIKKFEKQRPITWRNLIGFSLIPYSRSKETDLFEKYWVMENFMDFLIKKIREREISLKPDKDSGWYEYQQHVLEALLLPDKNYEAKKIEFGDEYKKVLDDVFKACLTGTRETFVKQLRSGEAPWEDDGGIASPLTIRVKPLFYAEPLSTAYLRYARSFRFLEKILDKYIGKENNLPLINSKEKIYDELKKITELMYGLYIISLENIGLSLDLKKGELTQDNIKSAKSSAFKWLKNYKRDKRLKKDVRLCLPVHHLKLGRDPKEWETQYWGVIGVSLKKIIFKYIKEPEVLLPKDIKKRKHKIFYQNNEYYIPIIEFVSFKKNYNLPPPTRDEFRKICNTYKTKEEIILQLVSPVSIPEYLKKTKIFKNNKFKKAKIDPLRFNNICQIKEYKSWAWTMQLLADMSGIEIIFDDQFDSWKKGFSKLTQKENTLEKIIKKMCRLNNLKYTLCPDFILIQSKKTGEEVRYKKLKKDPRLTEWLKKNKKKLETEVKIEKTKVSLTVNGKRLIDVLSDLSKMSNIKIIPYGIPSDEEVIFKVTDMPLTSALTYLLEPKGLIYVIVENNTILVGIPSKVRRFEKFPKIKKFDVSISDMSIIKFIDRMKSNPYQFE
jgi:hypothetical protein